MATTTTSSGRCESRAWKRSATVSAWTPGSRCDASPMTPTTAAIIPVTRTAVTCGPRTRPESSRRLSGRAIARRLAPAREVAVARAHEHGAVAMDVADGDGAGLDGRAGAAAGVRGDPRGAPDRRDAVRAVRAEAPALVTAPQLTPL